MINNKVQQKMMIYARNEDKWWHEVSASHAGKTASSAHQRDQHWVDFDRDSSEQRRTELQSSSTDQESLLWQQNNKLVVH